MITGIDHIGLQVRDLDATVKSYETIFGCTPNWRGGATGWRQAWFQFGNAALDIISPDGDSEQAQNIRADLDKFGEGVWGVGFGVADMGAAVNLFTRRPPDHPCRDQTRSEGRTSGQPR